MNAGKNNMQQVQAYIFGYPGITECPEYRDYVSGVLSRLWFPGPGCEPMEAGRKRHHDDTITSEGYKRLAIMVIVQAARDAYGGDKQAKKWLETTALDWLETLKFPVTRWFYKDWIQSGCPGVMDGRGFRGVNDDKRFDVDPKKDGELCDF